MTTTTLREATAASYLRMAAEANYRPWYIYPPEVEDLTPEALKYAEHFLAEEEDCTFNIGCPDYRDRAAFVFLIEAARLLCAVEHDAALELLDMARAAIVKGRRP